MVLIKRLRLFLAATVCILTLNAQTVLAANDGAEDKGQAILAYSNLLPSCIEASIMGDVVTLTRKNGKTELMSMKALNKGAKSEARTLWNLFAFYVVKDVWRGLIHQSKVMGQANFTLEIMANGKHKITRNALYVPGCAPIIGAAPIPPKVKEFWDQIKACIDYIDYKQMALPDSNVVSAKMNIILGRDLEIFPRYLYCNYKGLLMRDKAGKITRGTTSK